MGFHSLTQDLFALFSMQESTALNTGARNGAVTGRHARIGAAVQ
jgi:hypothetical protein